MRDRNNLPVGQFSSVEKQVEPFIENKDFQQHLSQKYILRSKQVYCYIAEAIDDNGNLCVNA